MMSTAKFTVTYPLLKERSVSLPKRSIYHHLQPVGINTPVVESLTSYISRLADTHSVSIGALYEYVIIPALNKPYLTSPPHLGPASSLVGSFRNQIKSINGVGKIAWEWSQLLMKMTLRNDLDYLTFLPWAGALSQLKLLRKIQAWCPACYDEMLNGDGVVYQQLIWSLELVQFCVHHRVRLVDQCPYCSSQFSHLTRRLKIGFCPHCYQWLVGKADVLAGKYSFTDDELVWQEFICNQIGELLKTTPSKQCPPSKDHISKWLQIIANKIAEGKVHRLATVLDKPSLTVHDWYYGNIKPSLLNLLKICYRMNMQLVDLVTGNGMKERTDFQSREFPAGLFSASPRRRNKPFNYSRVKKEMIRYSTLSPPISMHQVAINIGHNRSTLSKKFPELHSIITFRYKVFVLAGYKKCQEQKEEEIRRACVELDKAGTYLTARNVANFLGKPSYVGQRGVYTVVIAMRKQLGQSKK